ncbi:MAG TPA: MFS transporter [Alphaproteobacteria bacterium]|nr:MFS transporter [Alphaproteobacteria bacterium]
MDASLIASMPRVAAARWATSAVFFLNGFVLASWVPHVPEVKARLDLSDGVLGLALLGMALGAVVAMPLAGAVMRRFGSAAITAFAAFAFCLAFPVPVLASNLVWLVVGLVLFGAANGAMDVAMNGQAVAVERLAGRPIMSSFHALFSLGGLVGAGVAGVLLSAGVEPWQHGLGTPALAAVLLVPAVWRLLPAASDAAEEGPHFARPTGALVGLGFVAFCGLLSEGAMIDWSAVYMRDSLGAGAGMAAYGFAAYSLTMTAGRFAGDRLVAWAGPVAVLRGGGLLVAFGFGIGLLLHHPVAAMAAFAAVGLGLSNIVPVLFSAAGRTPGVSPGTGIAAVATLGYLGLLAGPPVIGLAAEIVTLPGALGLVALFGLVVAAAGRLVRR